MEEKTIKAQYSTKAFFSIAIPIIIQGMVFQLQNIANKAFLGNLKTDYLTAIGVTQSPFHMTMAVIMAIATGLGIIVGHRYGAKAFDEIKDAIRSTIGFNLVLGFVIMVGWLIFGRHIFGLMRVEKTIITYAMSYVGIIALYFPLYAIDSSIQATLQAFGVTKPIMYVGMIKVVLNVVLDWILIFGRFGLPAMGIQGAALATLLSNIIATSLLINYFHKTKSLPIHMKFSKMLGFQGAIYRKIVGIGLPTGLEFFLWHIGNLVLISLLNTLNKSGVAIYVLTTSIGIIVFMVYIALSQATTTLISQGMGAKDYEWIRKIMVRSVGYNLLVVTIFVGIVLLFKKPFLDIFTDDHELMKLALPMLTYLLVTIYPKSINVIVGHGIRALGKTAWMLYTQIGGTVFVISLSFFLVSVAKLGLEAIFITVMLDEVFRSIINTWYFIRQTHLDRIEGHVLVQ